MTIAAGQPILAADVLAIQASLNAFIGTAGQANGLAQLDANGNIPIAVLTSSLVQLMKTLSTALPGTSLTLYLNGLTLAISSQS